MEETVTIEIEYTETEANCSKCAADMQPVEIDLEVAAENESVGPEQCHRPYGLEAIPEHIHEDTAEDDLERREEMNLEAMVEKEPDLEGTPAKIDLETAGKEPAEIDFEATTEKDTDLEATTEKEPAKITAEKEPVEIDLEATTEKDIDLEATTKEEPAKIMAEKEPAEIDLEATTEKDTDLEATTKEEPAKITAEKEPAEIDLKATAEKEPDLEATTAEKEPAKIGLKATAEKEPAEIYLKATAEKEPDLEATTEKEPTKMDLEATVEKEPAEIYLEEKEPDLEATTKKEPDLEATAEKEPVEIDLKATAEKEPAKIESDLKEDFEPPITACHFGGWLPKDPIIVDRYLKRLIKRVYKTDDIVEIANFEKTTVLPLHPTLQEFKELIKSDPQIFKYFNLMFTQVPDPFRQIPNYDVMLRLLNLTISMAPPFYSSQPISIPMTAIMLRPMLTPAGNNAFLNDKVNKAFKKVLNAWCVYLKTPDSADVLNTETGWLSPDAMTNMPNFKTLYKCDPTLPHYGFESWDDFFIRKFRDGLRPVAQGDNCNIIANACEATPLVVRRNVQLHEKFWIKEQPYSLAFMLAGDPLTEKYEGGTVYQAFLSQFSYHRWHSPVDGTIIKAYNIDGSYFSGCYREDYHSSPLAYSQCYIASTAKRCLIFIESNNPYIGTIVFVGVGMADVSSCDITVHEGQKVKKGDKIGMFHYGGSTYCLVFEHGVNIKFVQESPEPNMENLSSLDVCAKLGEVLHD